MSNAPVADQRCAPNDRPTAARRSDTLSAVCAQSAPKIWRRVVRSSQLRPEQETTTEQSPSPSRDRDRARVADAETIPAPPDRQASDRAARRGANHDQRLGFDPDSKRGAPRAAAGTERMHQHDRPHPRSVAGRAHPWHLITRAPPVIERLAQQHMGNARHPRRVQHRAEPPGGVPPL
jgi:hypothetical protein